MRAGDQLQGLGGRDLLTQRIAFALLWLGDVAAGSGNAVGAAGIIAPGDAVMPQPAPAAVARASAIFAFEQRRFAFLQGAQRLPIGWQVVRMDAAHPVVGRAQQLVGQTEHYSQSRGVMDRSCPQVPIVSAFVADAGREVLALRRRYRRRWGKISHQPPCSTEMRPLPDFGWALRIRAIENPRQVVWCCARQPHHTTLPRAAAKSASRAAPRRGWRDHARRDRFPPAVRRRRPSGW